MKDLQTVVSNRQINIIHWTAEFLDIFFEKLQILVCHSFIHSSTTVIFPKWTQVSPKHNCVYSLQVYWTLFIILQGEIKLFHWNNIQATVHPYVIFFFMNTANTLRHTSYVVISKCLSWYSGITFLVMIRKFYILPNQTIFVMPVISLLLSTKIAFHHSLFSWEGFSYDCSAAFLFSILLESFMWWYSWSY
jgi:hypothetical protein